MKNQICEKINIKQAKEAIKNVAALYLSKNDDGEYRYPRCRARPICIMGPAGIGKTEIARQAAEEMGLAFVSYSITHHTRQSAIGLPRICTASVNGVEMTVTEYTMSEIIGEVYREMERSKKPEGILFLDEFNCVFETMRPIVLQLLQSKSFGPHKIPEGWLLVLAGNPPEYNSSVSEIDAVTADRLAMLYVEPDYKVWREYAIGQEIHPAILSFLDCNENYFFVFEHSAEGSGIVTPRGWEDLSYMLKGMEATQQPVSLPMVAEYLQVSSTARYFYTYYRSYQSIYMDDTTAQVLSGE